MTHTCKIYFKVWRNQRKHKTHTNLCKQMLRKICKKLWKSDFLGRISSSVQIYSPLKNWNEENKSWNFYFHFTSNITALWIFTLLFFFLMSESQPQSKIWFSQLYDSLYGRRIPKDCWCEVRNIFKFLIIFVIVLWPTYVFLKSVPFTFCS